MMYKPQDTVSLSPLQLAAVATSLMPDRQFTGFQEIEEFGEDFKATLLTTSLNENFVVRTASNHNSVGKFTAEVSLTKVIAGDFPVPEIVASNEKLAIYRPIHGVAYAPAVLNSAQIKSLAKSLAHLHTLPFALVENNGLPAFTNQQQQKIMIDTLDEAAQTGKVPAGLLERFENFLETDLNWAFDSAVINGDLRPSHIYFENDELSAISNWALLKNSDPAFDLAGVAPALPAPLAKLFYDTYRKFVHKLNKHAQLDPNLDLRAEFYSQFELVTALLLAKAAGESDKFTEIAKQLEQLDEKLRLGDELAQVEAQALKKIQAADEIRLQAELKDSLHTERIALAELPQQTAQEMKNTTGNILKSSPSLKTVKPEEMSEIEKELTQMLTENTVKIDAKARHIKNLAAKPAAEPASHPTGPFKVSEYLTGDIKKAPDNA